MDIYYSPSTGGFYDEGIHGPVLVEEPLTQREIKAGKRPLMVVNPDTTIPGDAVRIERDQHTRLMDAQSAGKQIVARGGKPVAVDRTVDLQEQAELRRRERDRRLAASDWTQLPDTSLDDEVKAAWATYRQALRDLDMTATDWPAAPSVTVQGDEK